VLSVPHPPAFSLLQERLFGTIYRYKLSCRKTRKRRPSPRNRHSRGCLLMKYTPRNSGAAAIAAPPQCYYFSAELKRGCGCFTAPTDRQASISFSFRSAVQTVPFWLAMSIAARRCLSPPGRANSTSVRSAPPFCKEGLHPNAGCNPLFVASDGMTGGRRTVSEVGQKAVNKPRGQSQFTSVWLTWYMTPWRFFSFSIRFIVLTARSRLFTLAGCCCASDGRLLNWL
jgi:hypothetical protein